MAHKMGALHPCLVRYEFALITKAGNKIDFDEEFSFSFAKKLWVRGGVIFDSPNRINQLLKESFIGRAQELLIAGPKEKQAILNKIETVAGANVARSWEFLFWSAD